MFADLSAPEPLGDAAADDDLRTPRLEPASCRQLHLRAQGEAHARYAANDYVGGLVAALLGEPDEHHRFLRHQMPPVWAKCYGRMGLDDVRLVAIDAALDLRLRAFANRHHVVVFAGRHQGFLQARVEHQHGGEDEYHQRQSAGGERRGEPAGPQVAGNVVERNGHVSYLFHFQIKKDAKAKPTK